MCFIANDNYDWIAAVHEEKDTIAQRAAKCHECCAPIPTGAFIHLVHQQESEECIRCRDGDCDCPCGGCCACETPDFGESFDYQRCEDCDKFLRAVEAAEIDEGCSPSEARPEIGLMIEDIREGDDRTHTNAGRYIRKALALFPELKANGYITRIAKQLT